MFENPFTPFYELGKDGLKLAYTGLQSFALILTLALAVILISVYLIIKFKKPENIEKFKTLSLGIVIGYAVTLSACVSIFIVMRLIVKEEVDTNFYLMLGFFALAIVLALTLAITKLFSDKAFRITEYVGIPLVIAYAIVMAILMPTVDEAYAPLSTAGMYIFTALIIIVSAVLIILFGKDNGTGAPTKSISYAGICIALSFALSYVKFFSLPQGGSVTLASALPLIVYAYIFGARKGVLAGVIYGALQCLQSPQFYQPLQILIDYPIAFGMLGLAGICKNLPFLKKPIWQFVFGASVALVLRYFCHVISGYYVFSSWMMEGYTALSWAFVYNLYVIVDLSIVLAVGALIFTSKAFVKQLDGINPPLSKTVSTDNN